MKTKYNGILIDYTKDELFDEFGLTLAKEKYLKYGENSPQEAFARTAVDFCAGDLELAQRIYEYSSNKWLGFSTPVLANSIYPNETRKALPISCFAGYVPDSIDGLLDHNDEIARLTILGGGTAGSWSDVRAVSKKAPGPIPFITVMDSLITAYHQGGVRRGSYAAYLDISHPDIMEFIKIRVPTGDASRKCNSVGFHNAVTVSDDFMNAVINNLEWNLIDPHKKDVRDTVNARELWQELLLTRARTGEPYIVFLDTANKALPETQKKQGLTIKSSNLCSEIMLPTDNDRTFVCCLSSINLEYYDDWKNTSIVEDMITFLDNVVTVFLDHAPDTLKKAKFSATKERALGLGVMGWHSLLQKNNLAFNDEAAYDLNEEVFKLIDERALKQTLVLGAERGVPDDMQGSGRRNSQLTAIAPTANNSIIVGASPSIEPWNANAFVQQTRVGSFLVKNKYLKRTLGLHGLDTEEVWKSIIANEGSIQHLDLPEVIKNIFKTSFEIDQIDIVRQAGKRQKYITQGQSLNLFFRSSETKEYFNKVHIAAWKEGCKALYYARMRTENEVKAVSVKNDRVKVITNENVSDNGECEACQ